MSAASLQSLLRFLSQDAKLPLATAMSKVQDLQKANLDSPDKLSKSNPEDLNPIFKGDEKLCKQILSAAKRTVKKRAAGEDASSPARKKRKAGESGSLFSKEPVAAEDLERSLALPKCELDEEALKSTVLFTNRAPLVLAFLVVLLKHTMPEQPLSGRLSLAQGYVSVTSRSRAVYLGIESGKSAEEEGFGEGQPTVVVAGKEIKVLRRWGYEWKNEQEETKQTETGRDEEEQKPALWALDLEALKKSGDGSAKKQSGIENSMPIYTPQSARAYIVKAFDTPSAIGTSAPAKKPSAAAKAAEKEQNLGKLLRALDLLYDSWAGTLSPEELDKRTWAWYVKVRPAVADGAAGWGGKNELKLADILALRQLQT